MQGIGIKNTNNFQVFFVQKFDLYSDYSHTRTKYRKQSYFYDALILLILANDPKANKFNTC